MNKIKLFLILFLLTFNKTVLAQQSILTDSNLPIIVINTDIDPNTNSPYIIPDEPKITATMKLIFRPDETRNYLSDISNTNFLNYNGKIGIELRGSSSQSLDKKPYGFSTIEEDGSNNNVSLLDMPKENDWVLNSLAFDPSMIRDYLSYTLASSLGNYAPRVKYVELIINDDYKGVYILTEKIKIDSDRLDLKKLSSSDNSSPDVTGGYIVKADKTTGGDVVAWTMQNSTGWNTDFLHHKPKTEDITTEQANYIKNVFFDLEDKTNSSNNSITNGYPAIIDIPSFIDYIIMAEIASNPDSYQYSTFFHKDKGGKLRAGPIWDYNLSFGNDLFHWGFDRSKFNIWQFENENSGAKFWKDLFYNSTFKCYLSKRWFELTEANKPLNYNTIVAKIDEIIALLYEAQKREQKRWGTVDKQLENIAEMKTWIQNRINWMNNNVGSFNDCSNISTPDLVISKIHYNPKKTDDYSSKDLEFIEITNNSNSSVDLTGIYITELGLSYQFPANSKVEANQKIYLCNNTTAFINYYGITPFGEYFRSLSNSSYTIQLSDAFGNIIDKVTYKDDNPWSENADGDGFYLQLNDIDSDNNLASNWSASSATLSNNNIATKQFKIEIYPNPTSGKINFKLNNVDTTFLEVTYFNTLGQTVAKFELKNNNSQINLSYLKKGIYFYSIRNKKGILTKNKIIKN